MRKGHAEWSPNGEQIAYFTWKDNDIRFASLMLATRLRGNLWESEQVPLPDALKADLLVSGWGAFALWRGR